MRVAVHPFKAHFHTVDIDTVFRFHFDCAEPDPVGYGMQYLVFLAKGDYGGVQLWVFG